MIVTIVSHSHKGLEHLRFSGEIPTSVGRRLSNLKTILAESIALVIKAVAFMLHKAPEVSLKSPVSKSGTNQAEPTHHSPSPFHPHFMNMASI